jgi:FkbM family methyltransferase
MLLGICRFFKIRRGNVMLRFFPTALSASLWIDAKDRQADDLFLQRYLRPGDTVVDIGANIGNLTTMAASVISEKGHVYAFEPHPRIHGFLETNVQLNGFANVSAFNVALGERGGQVILSDTRSDDQNKVGVESGITVAIMRLDEVNVPGEISLLKIDVEGHEKFVLLGAAETLKRVSCIYLEAGEPGTQAASYPAAEIIQLLKTSGFAAYRQIGPDSITAIADNYFPFKVENWIAVRDVAAFLDRSKFTLA